MKTVEIKPNIYWVGGIDWDIRNFHGYLTPRGTTYNAYLIKDKKITLIDTVKHYLYDEMLSRIQSIINPKKIDFIISNHVEMDHSGSLPKILTETPNAHLITSTRGQKGLAKHYHHQNWNLKVVQSGDTLNIGTRTLHFVHTPMVHWPDSMVTYSPTDQLLLPNDAFGQHIASTERFDTNIGWDIIREEAQQYYANIVMPYGDQVTKALDAVKNLDITMIAPSHGIIWTKHTPNIIQEYQKWATYQSDNKALIVYDTMWGSTQTIAHTLADTLNQHHIPVTMKNLKTTHISDIITQVLTHKLILIGSPTLNNGMLPSMGAFLTYLKGLRPQNKIGFSFGSYGWGGQAVTEIQSILTALKWDTPLDPLKIQYIPTQEDKKQIISKTQELVKYIK